MVVQFQLSALKLTTKVRDPRAGYEQSLHVLAYLKKNYPQLYTKSSLMLGLGETSAEILQAMEDLRKVKADFLTLGQYLRPSKNKYPVKKIYHPEEFKGFEKKGLEMGFRHVASGPMVRSSYKAGEGYFSTLG